MVWSQGRVRRDARLLDQARSWSVPHALSRRVHRKVEHASLLIRNLLRLCRRDIFAASALAGSEYR